MGLTLVKNESTAVSWAELAPALIGIGEYLRIGVGDEGNLIYHVAGSCADIARINEIAPRDWGVGDDSLISTAERDELWELFRKYGECGWFADEFVLLFDPRLLGLSDPEKVRAELERDAPERRKERRRLLSEYGIS